MRARRGTGHPVWAWTLTLLLLAGGLSALRTAAITRTAFRMVWAVDLPPDGRERHSPRLRSGRDYRVVVSGTLRNHWNGALYDAVDAFAPGEEPWPHGALTLVPPDFAPEAGRAVSHARTFAVDPPRGLEGERVVVRLDPVALAGEATLPERGAAQPLEGILRLELREHDPGRQSRRSAAWALLGLFLAASGGARLRAQWPRRRQGLRPEPGSELDLEMRRIGAARRQALVALADGPEGSVLRTRVEALHTVAWELARIAEAYARAAGLRGRRRGWRRKARMPDGEEESAPEGRGSPLEEGAFVAEAGEPVALPAGDVDDARGQAERAYREHLACLRRIEAALRALPVRATLALGTPAGAAEKLLAALQEELAATESAATAVRGGTQREGERPR